MDLLNMKEHIRYAKCYEKKLRCHKRQIMLNLVR